MKITRFTTASALFLMALVGTVWAQTVGITKTLPGPSQWVAAKRQVLAVKYHENKETAVNMSGTAIAPRAVGKAKVEFKHGRAKVKLEMENLGHPQSLGAFYTTYILWAVAPEGQAESLMELPIQTRFKVDATTTVQTFGLMITAEPHSRVELPSSVIVVENTLRRGMEGGIVTSKIEYSGDPGTFYTSFLPNSPPVNADYHTPLGVLGARRAVEIAQRADAQKFAEPELREAEARLATLEEDWPQSRDHSDLRQNAEQNSGLAHEVMRLGEQARSLSVKRSAQARLDAEHPQAGKNIVPARSEADRIRTATEFAEIMTRLARNDAGRARIEAERARKSDRLQTEEAKHERDATQQHLYSLLSEILETRREARGLVVNLSDALFDTGQATLKPGAREKLSKLAGILSAYPGGYRIEIEGYTDSVGSDGANLNLSRWRAESVRDYLVQNGVKPERVIAVRGLGESIPVAGNKTEAGRQVNRRVEIIIADQPESPAKAGNQ